MVLSVVALLGGILVGRVTAGHSSTPSASVVTPGNGANGGSGLNGGNGFFGGGSGSNGFNGGNGFFGGGNGTSNGSGNGTSNGSGNGTNSPATNSPATNSTAAKVTPAVVNINTTLENGAAAGTGMVLTSDGYVLTNNHVIDGETSITVELQNGSDHSASVVGYDATDDVRADPHQRCVGSALDRQQLRLGISG